MSARTKARKEALDQLFEQDIRSSSSIGNGSASPFRDYAAEILDGVVANKERIDELIRTYLQGWDFDRIPNVDRNILRIAIWELLWSKTPEAVVISEALKLAGDYSTEESPKFIHGLLSKLAGLKGQISI